MHAARRSPVWVFDLDDTLHHATPHIFPHINRAMTAYIERHLALDHAAATALRQHYWQRYGATLLGLIRHHGVDPHHFLAATHNFDDLGSLLITAPALKRFPATPARVGALFFRMRHARIPLRYCASAATRSSIPSIRSSLRTSSPSPYATVFRCCNANAYRPIGASWSRIVWPIWSWPNGWACTPSG